MTPPPLPTLEQVTRQTVDLHLAYHDGNLTRAARTLDISRQRLQKMLRKRGIGRMQKSVQQPAQISA